MGDHHLSPEQAAILALLYRVEELEQIVLHLQAKADRRLLKAVRAGETVPLPSGSHFVTCSTEVRMRAWQKSTQGQAS